jgi:hypothetical protein
MDGKPLSTAPMTVKHGLRGLDVDHNGTVDILKDGTIVTKNAPIATTRDGISGIDVNGDNKPDIALQGGASAPLRGPGARPDLRMPPGVDVVAPHAASASAPVDDGVRLASIGSGPVAIGAPPASMAGVYGNPATTLTGLGPISPVTADSYSTDLGTSLGAPRTPSSTPTGAPLAPMMMAGAGGGGGGGDDSTTKPSQPRTLLEDPWTDDDSAGSVLGRPT